MKYDPIMCMMVPDTVKTKDENKYVEKAIQLIKEGKGPLSILSTLKEMGLTPADANSYYAEARSRTGYRNNDSNIIDKAIKSCDATSVSSAKSGLKSKIDNWYRNAKIDYGVSGKFIDVREESGALVVYWEEDGKRKKYSFGKYWDDYSVEQLYNIWMEQAD